MKRPLLIPVAIIMLLVVFSAGLVYTGMTPQRQPAPHPTPAATRDERWLQDIDYLATQLPYLHVNAFHAISQDVFIAEVDALKARVPDLTDTEIIIEIARIVALVGDGHTTANIHTPDFIRRYPLGLAVLDDVVVVVGALESERQIIGGEVHRIGETPIDVVLDAITPLIARDNYQQLRQQQGLFLTIPEVLTALDILPDGENGLYTVRTVDGETVTVSVPPIALDEPMPLLSIYDALDLEPPISLTNRQANYWYTFLADSNTLFFQYNRASEDPQQPFADFNAEMFAFIDSNPVERIVVDLRYNGGGNSAILQPFIRELQNHPLLNAEGRIYVLIGRGTFSSALMNAIELRDQTAAILMGESSGGKPNHYGEVRRFTLPNSGLSVQYSTRFWNLVPELDTPALDPDILVVQTRKRLLSGRDVVLDTAIDHEHYTVER